MMLIPSLMMQPRRREARFQPFYRVRATIPAVILDSRLKLRPAVFTEVMQKPLLVEPDPEAVLHNLPLMSINCLKMPPGISEISHAFSS